MVFYFYTIIIKTNIMNKELSTGLLIGGVLGLGIALLVGNNESEEVTNN